MPGSTAADAVAAGAAVEVGGGVTTLGVAGMAAPFPVEVALPALAWPSVVEGFAAVVGAALGGVTT